LFVNADAGSSVDQHATVPLRASRGARIDMTRALDAFTNLDWLGPRVNGPAEREDLRRVSTILDLPISDGSATGPIRKTALIDVGIPAALVGALLVEVGWQSDSMAPLFPVFAGRVRITATSLVLEGRYAPPFGRLGLLIDERILHFVARRTGQAFLARLAAHLEGEPAKAEPDQ
jgi:hypothetical protein